MMKISDERMAELKSYPLNIRIRTMRVFHNLSRAELAESLGCASTTVTLWENNQSQPTNDNMIKLAQIFDLPLNFFLEK